MHWWPAGVIPAVVGARSVAEKLGIHSVHVSYCPIFLPSPHHRPHPLPGWTPPPDVTDNRVLWELAAQGYNAVFGPALNTQRIANGLPPVDNVRHYVFGDHPWLAADPVLAPWPEPADLDVVQTGAWILPDDRPLPAELEAFLDVGPPPVYVGFGSMRAPADVARVAIEAIRAQGCRVLIARGWADLALVDDRDDCFAVGEVNQQAPTTESLSAALSTALTPQTRARARAVAGTISTDGATVATKLLLDGISG